MNQKWIKLMNRATLDATDYTWVNLKEIKEIRVEKGAVTTAEVTIKEIYLITVIDTKGSSKFYYGDIHIIYNFEKVMMSGVE
jgi:hypothetical protein